MRAVPINVNIFLSAVHDVFFDFEMFNLNVYSYFNKNTEIVM